MPEKITNLGFNFNAADVAPSEAMEAIPAGWYPVVLSDAEVKVNDNGEGRRLSLTWTVLEGTCKGRKVFDGFNYIHSNPTAQEIGQRDLSAICHATGVLNIADASQLLNKPHQIKVDVEAGRHVDADGNTVASPVENGKSYNAKNRFKGAKAYSATGTTTAAPGAAPAAAKAPATPPWAATGTPAGATIPAPAAAPAAAAPEAAKPKGKPGRPPKAPAAAAPVVERKFWIGVDGFDTTVPESEVVANFGKGMPVDTPLMLEGESEWKDAAAYGVATAAPAPVAAPAPAPVPAKPAPTPAPAAAAPAKLPPWAVKA